METIYEQIGRVRSQLVEEAQNLVERGLRSADRKSLRRHRAAARRRGRARERWAD